MRARSRQSAYPCTRRARSHCWNSQAWFKPYPILVSRQAKTRGNFCDPYKQPDIYGYTGLDYDAQRLGDRPELHLLARFEQVTVDLNRDRLVCVQYESGQVVLE